MAAPPGQTLTITGPDGQPQLVYLIALPITAAELALALANLPPPPVEDEVSSFPASPPPGRPKVAAAGKSSLFSFGYTDASDGVSTINHSCTLYYILVRS